MWMKTAGKWGSIFVVIALVIALLKQLIAFVGFITFAIKAVIVLAFVVVFVGVGYLVFKSFSEKKRARD